MKSFKNEKTKDIQKKSTILRIREKEMEDCE
jgi:hypothetical protein